MKVNRDKNKHYNKGIDTIAFIKAKLTEEQFQGYLLGNTIKYLSRLNYKESAKSDAEKALVYLTWFNEELGNVE